MLGKDHALKGAQHLWRFLPCSLKTTVLRLLNDTFFVGVLGIVPNERNEILLLEHRFRPPWPWGLPGGFVRHKEELKEALAREIHEETTLVIDPIEDPYKVLSDRFGTLTVIYGTRPVNEAKARPLRFSHEIVSGAFCGPNTLPARINPHHREILEAWWDSAGHASLGSLALPTDGPPELRGSQGSGRGRREGRQKE